MEVSLETSDANQQIAESHNSCITVNNFTIPGNHVSETSCITIIVSIPIAEIIASLNMF